MSSISGSSINFNPTDELSVIKEMKAVMFLICLFGIHYLIEYFFPIIGKNIYFEKYPTVVYL